MNKRALSAIPRQTATDEIVEAANNLSEEQYIATAEFVENGTIMMMHVYRISNLKKGERNANFRIFFSNEDYINQILDTDKVKWTTASLCMMNDFDLFRSSWDINLKTLKYIELVYIRSMEEKKMLCDFFQKYVKKCDKTSPWFAVYRFQKDVKAKRLAVKHKKETDPIDRLMKTVTAAPKEFEEWIWSEAMSFSRYLVYKPVGKNFASCECTYCKKKLMVERNKVRLKNNENGKCPNCGKRVTIKAKGRMQARINDERWVSYIDPREGGFIWRYYHVSRIINRDNLKVRNNIYEVARSFYTFENGKPQADTYEYTEYKQTGKTRWCHDRNKISCGLSTLYPENLPQAWESTPLKYSALEILSKNIPTKPLYYEWGIGRFLKFPSLEWIIKMGLNSLAGEIIGKDISYNHGINFKGQTIYDILQLNKANVRILQQIDGNEDELRLLQAAEKIGLRLQPEQLQEYYESFGCNIEFLKKTKRKVSLRKLVKYINAESEDYPKGESFRRISYGQYARVKDSHIEKKRNMANDWIEYIGWCKELKYDLDNMFIYMPKNFKKVHDRIAKEYQTLQDKKAAAEKKRREKEIKNKMEQTKAVFVEIMKVNKGNTDAFSLKGKGLVLVVPESAEDIKAEGEALHHCVGTYIERIAKGETSIFFIRKKEAPDKPYYTMEWKNNKVQQCRGLHNCDMTPEIKAFTKAFEKIMLKTIKTDKSGDRKAG